MSENYFKNLRIVGNNLDEGILKLQEIWKMPHLLLCKNNNEDQIIAKNVVENLRNEINILKETLENSKLTITCLQKVQNQFIQESIESIKTLKEAVEDTKILFAENGYIEGPLDHNLSILSDQLDSLSINNSNLLNKNSKIDNEPYTFANSL